MCCLSGVGRHSTVTPNDECLIEHSARQCWRRRSCLGTDSGHCGLSSARRRSGVGNGAFPSNLFTLSPGSQGITHLRGDGLWVARPTCRCISHGVRGANLGDNRAVDQAVEEEAPDVNESRSPRPVVLMVRSRHGHIRRRERGGWYIQQACVSPDERPSRGISDVCYFGVALCSRRLVGHSIGVPGRFCEAQGSHWFAP